MPESDRTGPPHVVVIGLMGVGKTTIGRALASELGRAHFDSDEDIEILTGVTSGHFAELHGLSRLHELEAAVLLGALTRDQPSVVSAAASTVENELVRIVLRRRAVVVRLVADLELTLARQQSGDHRRSMDRTDLAELAARREPFFVELEDLTVATDRSVDDTIREIVRSLPPA